MAECTEALPLWAEHASGRLFQRLDLAQQEAPRGLCLGSSTQQTRIPSPCDSDTMEAVARDVPRLIQALHAREIRGTVWDSVTAVYLQLFALQAATSQENPSWAIEVSPMVPAAHRVLGPFQSSGLGLYVASVHGKGLISTTARDTVARIWDEFVSFFPGGRLPEPDAAPASNQGLMLAFDDGDNHLEFEILPDGPTEVFFLCRQTGETWDTVLPTGPLSFCSALIQKLHLFAGA